MKFTDDEILKNKIKQYKRKKNIATIAYIIIIPIILYNVSLIIQSIVKPNKTPSFFGIKTFVIVSGSMEPTLNIGDVILVKDIEENDIKENDIISYREGQSIVTHRVIEIEETENGKKFITKGDNNNVKDSYPVRYRDIEGKYDSKINGIGNVVLFFQNKIVIICVILIFYLIYMHDANKQEKSIMRRAKRNRFENKYVQK